MFDTKVTLEYPKRRSLKNLLTAGSYDEINYLITEAIKKKSFAIENEKVGKREIALLTISKDISSTEVLDIARGAGYAQPSPLDALLLGEQFPDEQKKKPIIFLLEKKFEWSGYAFDLLLECKNKKRRISMIAGGGNWAHTFTFALLKTK